MSSVSDCAWVRGYVLNSLEDGPVRVADLIRFGEAEFGFSRGEDTGNGSALRGHRTGSGWRTVLDATCKPVRHLVGLASR